MTCLALGTIVSPILSFLALISLLGLGAAIIVESGYRRTSYIVSSMPRRIKYQFMPAEDLDFEPR